METTKTFKLYTKLIDKVNDRYIQLKAEKMGKTVQGAFAYTPPEILPQISSDQVKAVLWVLAETLGALNIARNDIEENNI